MGDICWGPMHLPMLPLTCSFQERKASPASPLAELVPLPPHTLGGLSGELHWLYA